LVKGRGGEKKLKKCKNPGKRKNERLLSAGEFGRDLDCSGCGIIKTGRRL